MTGPSKRDLRQRLGDLEADANDTAPDERAGSLLGLSRPATAADVWKASLGAEEFQGDDADPAAAWDVFTGARSGDAGREGRE